MILVGEIRDRESMEAVIHLAGTGHLVIATMHANNAPETLDRMINLFPQDQHRQVYSILSTTCGRSSRSAWFAAPMVSSSPL